MLGFYLHISFAGIKFAMAPKEKRIQHGTIVNWLGVKWSTTLVERKSIFIKKQHLAYVRALSKKPLLKEEPRCKKERKKERKKVYLMSMRLKIVYETDCFSI